MINLGRFSVFLIALTASSLASAVPISFDFDLTQQDNALEIQSSGSFTVNTDDASLTDGFLYASEITSIDFSLNGYTTTLSSLSGGLAFDYDYVHNILSLTIGVTGDTSTVDDYFLATGGGTLQFSLITGPGGYTNFWSSISSTNETMHYSSGGLFTLYSSGAYGVPESATLMIMVAGLLGFGFAGRKNRT